MTISEFRNQHPELFKNAVDSIDWGEVTENLDAYRSFDYLRSDLQDHFQSYIYKYLDKWPK